MLAFGERHRRPLAVAVGLVAAFSLLSVACGSSGYAYVSSSDHRAFFKIPQGWHFFDKRDLLVASGQSLSGGTDQQVSWLIGFDAAPKPDPAHVLALTDPPTYPVVLAEVRTLGFSEQDQMSLRSMRNEVYPVDRLLDANDAEILSTKSLVFPGGLHGSEYVYDVVLGGVSNVYLGNIVIRVFQAAIVDPPTNTLYLFVVRCESHCYRDYSNVIAQVAKSWTVKER